MQQHTHNTSAKPYSVSVIVPVYNVAPYIKPCMESLVQQTLKSIEILVIDDGSTDNTYTILQEYEQYAFVKVVRLKKNRGVCSVRKVGINLAQGEYIGFVDGDDFIEHTMYKNLHENAVHNQSDMVVCDLCYLFPNGIRRPSIYDRVLYKHIHEFNTGEIKIIPLKFFSYWNKLFHHTLFEHVKRAGYNPPDHIFMGDDLLYVIVLLYFSKHLSYVSKPLYIYRLKEKINYKQSYIDDTKIVMDSLLNFFAKQVEVDKKLWRVIHKILLRNLLLTQLNMIRLAEVTDLPQKKLFDYFNKIIINQKTYNYFSAALWVGYYICRNKMLGTLAWSMKNAYRTLKKII